MIEPIHPHSIRFGDGTLVNGRFSGYDTWDDWHLIPSSRPTIAMPGVETKFVTIPGMDGSIDLSQFLRSDRPAFGNRAGTFEFYAANPGDDPGAEYEFWMTVYPKMLNAIHGKQFKMVLNEDDPDWYWEGRFTVDKYESNDGYHSVVAISYQVGPYKWKIRTENQPMTWDNFNFERDYDNGVEAGYCYSNGGVVQINVTGADNNTRVIIGSESISTRGRTNAKIVRQIYGKTRIQLSGNGSMTWREGSL